MAAHLSNEGNHKDLKDCLTPFLKTNIDKRRNKQKNLNIENPFTRQELVFIQRFLQNMPREVFQVANRRASVVIPLCNVNGVASILFERRSSLVRTHKNQVCFPGGMVDDAVDSTIIQTSLREMEEEIGIAPQSTEVLGILRCNWEEVATMTGVSVTPVVGYIGDLKDIKLKLNPAEVIHMCCQLYTHTST
jgi:nudix motif 8